MEAVKKRAKHKAFDDANVFFEKHELPDLLRQFAETYNKMMLEFSSLNHRIQREILSPEDYEDMCYYRHYCEVMGVHLASLLLKDSGYVQDENGYWILN